MHTHTHKTHTHTNTYSIEVKVRMSRAHINHRICDISPVKHKYFYDFKNLELRTRLLRRNAKTPLDSRHMYTKNLYYIHSYKFFKQL